jgi:hypothetical protein
VSDAGKLQNKVSFSQRVEVNPDAPNDYGVTVGEWQEQFVEMAEYIHYRGGEEVLAARLAGRHIQVIRIRANTRTRRITSDWKAVDVKHGTEFNIRDVTHVVDRQWIDLLCEAGVSI